MLIIVTLILTLISQHYHVAQNPYIRPSVSSFYYVMCGVESRNITPQKAKINTSHHTSTDLGFVIVVEWREEVLPFEQFIKDPDRRKCCSKGFFFFLGI